MKLLLNDTEHNHFEMFIPVNRNRPPRLVKYGSLERQKWTRIPASPQSELATVTIFTNANKCEVASEWIFKDETLDKTEDKITINGAVMMTSYILE